MAAATTVSPIGQEYDSQRFFVHLNELVLHLKQYLASGEAGTLDGECCKKMEEAFEFWEKFCIDGTSEQLAPKIATSTPEILQIFHDFMSKVSGQS